MPNHVASYLVVTGPSIDVHRFVSSVDRSNNEDGKTFDFNGLVPMPEELRLTSSPVRIQTQAEIDTAWADYNQKKADGKLDAWQLRDGRPFGLGMTQEHSDSLVAKYGTNNWYDWANINWGTKWGAYDSGDWVVTEGESGNATAAIFYNTAWSPACPFFHHVSHQFPTLTFDTQVADEGGNFVSEISYEQGETTVEEDYEWKSEDGIRVREVVGYGPTEDDEETEEEAVAE